MLLLKFAKGQMRKQRLRTPGLKVKRFVVHESNHLISLITRYGKRT